jgi:hypothetical protein
VNSGQRIPLRVVGGRLGGPWFYSRNVARVTA